MPFIYHSMKKLPGSGVATTVISLPYGTLAVLPSKFSMQALPLPKTFMETLQLDVPISGFSSQEIKPKERAAMNPKENKKHFLLWSFAIMVRRFYKFYTVVPKSYNVYLTSLFQNPFVAYVCNAPSSSLYMKKASTLSALHCSMAFSNPITMNEVAYASALAQLSAMTVALSSECCTG